MKIGRMKATFTEELEKELSKKSKKRKDCMWQMWFRRVMKIFKNTKAEITSCSIDAQGSLDITYKYEG